MPGRNSLRDRLSTRTSEVPHAGHVLRWLSLAWFILASSHMTAQGKSPGRGSATFPVLMMSDIHFDPLHDPAKVALLVKAPVSQWTAILAKPESPQQATSFAAIQQTCNAKKSTDTTYALFRSSLSAATENTAAAAFVTVSGDLLVHDLDCRYRASMGLPPATTDDQSLSADFAEKTTVFVMQQIEAAFPRIPVYLALGNNDSRCNHNRLDPHDHYLKASAAAVINGLRGVSASDKTLASSTYSSAGYYSVTMPSPMLNTRLIVVNDIYMMPKYADCKADETDHDGEQEQSAWLEKQMDAAKNAGQRVWILGHLPPSVNPDASLAAGASFCATGKVVRFQTTDELANQLIAHSDIVKLGIFGHTHMDEFHLLRGDKASVPIKVVAAISPVDGNLPSFTVALVDRASATLADYAVYETSNRTGTGTSWSKEYSFDAAYQETSFSAPGLSDLIQRLRVDTGGTGSESRAYQTHFLKGSSGKKLSSSWPGYVCSLDHVSVKGFKDCFCRIP
jgi:sphingomyelin phosphodiesterase acid-like 3